MLFFKYILEVSNFVENCCLFIIPDGPKNMLFCCMEVLMKAETTTKSRQPKQLKRPKQSYTYIPMASQI